ncbi:helix-turn-helix domain-containing protein [Bacillus pumilus]|nr:helix-turn-helix domain-containing protein [Bacillus pumilus]
MDSKTTELGTLLKKRLQQRSLSLRELSTYTEIDKATMSRIMNGKENHL